MKNTIKMSLAAAVAVSALTTTASAGNLEEMIKGVEVSGYVDYRLEDKATETKTAGGTTNTQDNYNEYSVNVTATSKVNDIVSATVSAGFDEVQISNSSTAKAGGLDTSAPVGVDQAYFTFDLGATTVMAGKQNIPSVFVDQSDTVKQGAGVVALHKVNDALTLAGAHFLNNNIAADTKTSELIAMGKVGMFNYSVNYNYTDVSAATLVAGAAAVYTPATVVGASDTLLTAATAAVTGPVEANRYSIYVGTSIEGINLGLRYSAASTDNTVGNDGATIVTFDDAQVIKFDASAKLGSVKLKAMYANVDDQKAAGGAVGSDVAIDGDNDSKVHAKVWQLSTSKIAQGGDLYMISAGMPLMDKLTGSITYAEAEGDQYAAGLKNASYEADELLLKLTYKMSKNFTIHGRYSILDEEKTTVLGVKTDTTTDYSRVQVKYTF